jgi:hypothetical protein
VNTSNNMNIVNNNVSLIKFCSRYLAYIVAMVTAVTIL